MDESEYVDRETLLEKLYLKICYRCLKDIDGKRMFCINCRDSIGGLYTVDIEDSNTSCFILYQYSDLLAEVDLTKLFSTPLCHCLYCICNYKNFPFLLIRLSIIKNPTRKMVTYTNLVSAYESGTIHKRFQNVKSRNQAWKSDKLKFLIGQINLDSLQTEYRFNILNSPK